MSFLAPWALLIAGAAAVPLLLHLLRRRTGTRVEFPALRYLLRAEREHAREVRLRNIALMLLRVGVVLAVALAMARPVGLLPGVAHPPTAVVLVIDNSLSSGAAGPDGPTLAQLVGAAQAVVAASRAGDELALVTWDGEVTSGSRADLATALAALRPLDGAGNAEAALARARALLDASALPERQLVVLTDAQASGFAAPLHDGAVSGRAPLVFVKPLPALRNRAVASATPEPLHWSPRGSLRAAVRGDSASWRLLLDGRPVARGTAAPGESIVARVQPAARGWVAGRIELEPDELRGDDHRWFAVHIGEPPAVLRDPSVGPFVSQALGALSEAGRVRSGADVTVAAATAARRPGLLFAPADPLQVPAANRALERAGIPVRLAARRTGERTVRGSHFEEVVVREWFDLEVLPGATPLDTLARIGTAPWMLAGDGFVLVASAATATATDFPVRAGFLPWLDAMLSERLATQGGSLVSATPRARVVAPTGVTALALDDSTQRPVAPGEFVTLPAASGVYFWLRGASRAGAVVVNGEPAESDLAALPGDSVARLLGADEALDAPESLARNVFAAGGRRALAAPLLLLALLLLLAESLVARRGRPSAVPA